MFLGIDIDENSNLILELQLLKTLIFWKIGKFHR